MGWRDRALSATSLGTRSYKRIRGSSRILREMTTFWYTFARHFNWKRIKDDSELLGH